MYKPCSPPGRINRQASAQINYFFSTASCENRIQGINTMGTNSQGLSQRLHAREETSPSDLPGVWGGISPWFLCLQAGLWLHFTLNLFLPLFRRLRLATYLFQSQAIYLQGVLPNWAPALTSCKPPEATTGDCGSFSMHVSVKLKAILTFTYQCLALSINVRFRSLKPYFSSAFWDQRPWWRGQKAQVPTAFLPTTLVLETGVCATLSTYPHFRLILPSFDFSAWNNYFYVQSVTLWVLPLLHEGILDDFLVTATKQGNMQNFTTESLLGLQAMVLIHYHKLSLWCNMLTGFWK